MPDSGDEGDAGFLLRVNTDGTLDRSFGVNGVVLSRFFGEGITDIVVQSDGKILAAGMEWVSF